jgi:hypothetical protein
MPRPPSYPLPLVAGSRRPSSLRCDSCFHIGAAVRVGSQLLCGECFYEHSASEEEKRLGTMDQRMDVEVAYDHVA